MSLKRLIGAGVAAAALTQQVQGTFDYGDLFDRAHSRSWEERLEETDRKHPYPAPFLEMHEVGIRGTPGFMIIEDEPASGRSEYSDYEDRLATVIAGHSWQEDDWSPSSSGGFPSYVPASATTPNLNLPSLLPAFYAAMAGLLYVGNHISNMMTARSAGKKLGTGFVLLGERRRRRSMQEYLENPESDEFA